MADVTYEKIDDSHAKKIQIVDKAILLTQKARLEQDLASCIARRTKSEAQLQRAIDKIAEVLESFE